MSGPKHLRAVPDVIDETIAAARHDARWADSAPTYPQYVEASGLDDWQTRIKLIRARDALEAQLENDGDEPDDGAEALAQECEQLRSELLRQRAELNRELDRFKQGVTYWQALAGELRTERDRLRDQNEELRVKVAVGEGVVDQAKGELTRLYKVQAQLVDAAQVVRGVCGDADRGYYRTRDDLWWLIRLDALAERLPKGVAE